MSAAFQLRASDEDIELLEDSGVFALEEILEDEEPELGVDTSALVAACLANVREVARLEDAVMFPPLPAPAPRREVVVFPAGALAIPTPGTIVRESAATSASAKSGSANAVTQKTPRSAGSSRWPVALCALVAIVASAAAFVASPAAERSGVKRVTRSVAGQVARTAAAAADAVAR